MAAMSKDCTCLLYAIREYFCCLGKRTKLVGLAFEIKDIDLAESEGLLPLFHPEVYMYHTRTSFEILA
jgi:hypothetical protein